MNLLKLMLSDEGKVKCRECTNRTKPFIEKLSWCLIKDQPVSSVIMVRCAAFKERGKEPLQEPGEELFKLAERVRNMKRRKQPPVDLHQTEFDTPRASDRQQTKGP